MTQLQDIGIATYLMLLWKVTFSSGSDDAPNNLSSNLNEPWKKWPRPPGSFLDLGYAYSALAWIILSFFQMRQWSVDPYPSSRGIRRLRNRFSCTSFLEPLSRIYYTSVHAPGPIQQLPTMTNLSPTSKLAFSSLEITQVN